MFPALFPPRPPFSALEIILDRDKSVACEGLSSGVPNVRVIVVLLGVPGLLHAHFGLLQAHFSDSAASRITTRATARVTVRAAVRVMGTSPLPVVPIPGGPPAALR